MAVTADQPVTVAGAVRCGAVRWRAVRGPVVPVRRTGLEPPDHRRITESHPARAGEGRGSAVEGQTPGSAGPTDRADSGNVQRPQEHPLPGLTACPRTAPLVPDGRADGSTHDPRHSAGTGESAPASGPAAPHHPGRTRRAVSRTRPDMRDGHHHLPGWPGQCGTADRIARTGIESFTRVGRHREWSPGRRHVAGGVPEGRDEGLRGSVTLTSGSETDAPGRGEGGPVMPRGRPWPAGRGHHGSRLRPCRRSARGRSCSAVSGRSWSRCRRCGRTAPPARRA